MIRIFLLLTLLVSFAGCTSRTIKNNITDVKLKKNSSLEAHAVKGNPLEYTAEAKINPKAFDHFSNAVLYEETGKLAQAAEEYKITLQTYPNSYTVRFSLAQVYFKLRKYSDVISLLDIIKPEDESVTWIRAASFMALGNVDSAHYHFRATVVHNPRNLEAYSFMSGYYRKNKDHDSLLWAYENMTRIKPNHDRFWLELGRFQAEANQMDNAKGSFLKALEVTNDSNLVVPYLALGDIYRFEKKPDSSKYYYELGIAIDSNNSAVNNELAMIYFQMDSLLKALPFARKVAELNPVDRMQKRRLAVLYYGLDSMDVSDSIFTVLVNSGEREPVNHFYLGRIALRNEENKIAIEEFQILTELSDSIPSNWFDLAFACRQFEDTKMESATYSAGLKKMRTINDSLAMMFACGAFYERIDQQDSSIVVFKNILTMNENHDQAMNYLGYLLADRGEQLDYALELIKKANNLSPDNPAYLDSYGWVYYKMGKFKKSLKYLTQASKLTEDTVIFEHLGDAYQAVGKKDKAVIWWKKALELTPENEDIQNKIKTEN